MTRTFDLLKPLADWIEPEVRALRNAVYDSEIQDSAWAACGPNWMRTESLQGLIDFYKNDHKIP